jgi:ketosteroid isomerase-like protein
MSPPKIDLAGRTPPELNDHSLVSGSDEECTHEPTVWFVFPGDDSWSGEIRGKQELRRWLERMVRMGIKTCPDEVVAAGPPWRTTVCVRGHDHLTGPDGEQAYENRFVIWGKLRWGKLYDYEVYEDTQTAKALDEWLAEHEHALAS